jgi:hypothetical protein
MPSERTRSGAFRVVMPRADDARRFGPLALDVQYGLATAKHIDELERYACPEYGWFTRVQRAEISGSHRLPM